MNMKPKNIATCPECGADIRFRKVPYLHQTKTCPECNVELEVVNKNPIEVDVVFASDLTYEEDDDFYDYDDDSAVYHGRDDESVRWS
ncbi:MAG: hypothetical protein KDD89_01050 [Anaerolineales bacterium]|nr:hypothetical protein [Anaerolineales bacterium]